MADAQLVDEHEPVAPVVDVRLVDLVGALPELRTIHGDVGAAHQPDAVGGVRRRHRDADAGADAHADGVELEGLLEQRRETLGEPAAYTGSVSMSTAQLVATDPDQHVGAAQRPHQAWAELPEQLVAGGVPESESLISLKWSRSTNRNARLRGGVSGSA